KYTKYCSQALFTCGGKLKSVTTESFRTDSIARALARAERSWIRGNHCFTTLLIVVSVSRIGKLSVKPPERKELLRSNRAPADISLRAAANSLKYSAGVYRLAHSSKLTAKVQ